MTWILSIRRIDNALPGLRFEWSLTQVTASGSKSLIDASWGTPTPHCVRTNSDIENYIVGTVKTNLYVNNMFCVILKRYGWEQVAGHTALVIDGLCPTDCVVLQGIMRKEEN